jgi:hypothetical protein
MKDLTTNALKTFTGRWSDLLVRLRRRAHHPPLPSILLANAQSLDNKIDQIRARVAFQRDIRDCNIFCFTEMCLSLDMLSESVQPLGIFVRRAGRNKHLSGNKRAWGVCFLIKDSWCNCKNIQEVKSFCSPDLEFLTIKCRLYYLQSEFSSVIVTDIYPSSSRYHDGPQRTSLDFMQTGNHISWGCIYCSWRF